MAHRGTNDYNSNFNRSRRRDDDHYPSKLSGQSQKTEDMFEIYRRDQDDLSKEVRDFIDASAEEFGDRVFSV